MGKQMSVVEVGFRTPHREAKEAAAGESPELLCTSAQANSMCKKHQQHGSCDKMDHSEGELPASAGNEKTWYVDSKGHFEYVSRYEQLSSERN